MRRIYVWNAALLGAHEVDSGYWREWELFRLPGGAGLFVALHVALFAILVWGYGEVVEGRRAGAWMSALLAASGLLAGVLHGAFLATGHPQFRSGASLAILAALAGTSLVQAAAARAALRSRVEAASGSNRASP
jgi:hypothetical protein